jgi:hypothetical protein
MVRVVPLELRTLLITDGGPASAGAYPADAPEKFPLVAAFAALILKLYV